MELSKTAKRALAAYGGADRWRQAGAAEATVTVGSLLFRLKRRMPFPRARVRTEIWHPHAWDRATTREDHDEYLRASRELVGLRIRYLNALDLLEKLRADWPDSSARLLGGG